MNAAEFEHHALAMLANGYSPLPIAPGAKFPGYAAADGTPQKISGWDRYCVEQPSEHTIAAWLRMIGDRETGLGVACGRGLIVVDIDSDDCVDAVQAALPLASVIKRGRKGASLFFRDATGIIATKHFRVTGGGTLVDLLSSGTQSCLPPTRHPDGMFYQWVSEDTLFDTPLDHLTEAPDDIVERLAKALAPFGHDLTAERPPSMRAPVPAAARSAMGASSVYRQANDDALAHIMLWAPKLELYKGRPARGGYEAVAAWRKSGSGQPLERRKRNLSISPRGIEDFGTGEKMTPIDVVMRARYCNHDAALGWLLEHLPQEPLITLKNRKQ
jgi:hypothetical protein